MVTSELTLSLESVFSPFHGFNAPPQLQIKWVFRISFLRLTWGKSYPNVIAAGLRLGEEYVRTGRCVEGGALGFYLRINPANEGVRVTDG